MIKPPYYHIGILVLNHEEAIEHYANLLDVTFTEPTDTVLCIENPLTQQTENLKVVAAYSRTRPPYLELIQAGGNGIFSEKNAGQILYFGIWESDLEGRIKKLKEQGTGIDALIRPACGKPPTAVITAPDKMGIRMEYLSTSLRLATEAWVITGKYPL
ncbi:VOC family protein [Nitrosospira sp. Is2]|uniref:VOC family protein n=1 Tax=Nitrosospira sp. Is2 TaxID=3080532 RepID=UPI002954CCCA|nr:VOC family protein [Nitrosospira sp. Is2]WON72490.1 VOC family protein [Nitrosospira sp. Is2]